MADNFVTNPGAAGATFRSKDRAGVETSIVIIDKNIGGAESLTSAFPSQGDVGHGSDDSGNPVKVGHKSVALGSDPTAVTTGQRADGPSNTHGVPFGIGGHPNTKTLRVVITNTQANLAAITGAGGSKIAVTRIRVAASNANVGAAGVDPSILVGFHATATPTGNQVVYSHPGLPAGFQDGDGNGGGLLGCGADADALLVTTSTFTGVIELIITYHVLAS